MKSLTFAASVLLSAAVVGCDPNRLGGPSTSAVPPTPPIQCNAIWTKGAPPDHGDTVVIARCRGADEYAKTSAGKDWNYHWHMVPMDVLGVERGTWSEKVVNFVYPDEWPTPESGIMIDKDVFPFAKGYVFALALKTTGPPATIVSFERRSYVAPHGPLKLASREADYVSILKAVADFETTGNVPIQRPVADTFEDIGDAWVVHRRDGWGTGAGSWLYRVDKETVAVQAISVDSGMTRK